MVILIMRKIVDPTLVVMVIGISATVYGISFRAIPVHINKHKQSTIEKVEPMDNLNEGLSLLRLGSYYRASEFFQKAINEGNRHQLAYEGLAECQFYMGDYDTSLQTCDTIHRYFPNSGIAYHIQGLIYLKKGDREQANIEFITAAKHGSRTSSKYVKGAN